MKKYYINEEKKISKLLKNKSLNTSNKVIKYMYEDLKLLSTHINETTKQNIACSKGCSHCCNTRVEITEPEAVFIYSYIKDNLNQEQQNAIFSKIKEITNITSQMQTTDDHIKLQIPCIFLNNQICSIYEIRPFICREFHSVDLESCLNCYNKLEKNAGALESNKIKDSYYRIFRKYMHIYRENKLQISGNEFLSSLLKIHETPNYIKNYFSNLK
ncbi:YkgJ family cysteine cluster protein [Arcobacter sp. s6]|uniref:YkgJ family cysteine cluster protein n=1 Tax=Arcobacter sp. s6 TaxID=3230363 RepID=UPI0034A07AF1